MQHQLEPCEHHIRLLMSSANNTHSEAELRSNMHCNGACLRADNPMRECTFLGPDGVDAMLARDRMPRNDPERKRIWKDQQKQVWMKEKQIREGRGERVHALEDLIHETQELLMEGYIEGPSGSQGRFTCVLDEWSRV